MSTQRDRDGTVLPDLPPIWNGLTAKGVTPPVTAGTDRSICLTEPFAIDDPKGFNKPLGVATRDLWHLFYQNQMQIDGGKNDKFVAFADSGALVMGHYDGAKLPLWPVAQAIHAGRQFLHGRLRRLVPQSLLAGLRLHAEISERPTKARPRLIAAVEADGVTLKLAANSPKSALEGLPEFVNNGQITPDFYAINTHAAAVSAEQEQAGRRAAIRLRRSEDAEHAAAAT